MLRLAPLMILFVTTGAGPTGCGTGRPAGVSPVGVSCVSATECASGFCADGLCCQTACGGTCQSCALPTSLGTCALIPAGGPPTKATQCPAENVSTCGLDGTCDGTGKCRSHQTGTVCKTGTCDSGSIVGIYVCDGAGTCKPGASAVCAPFSCDPTTNLCFPTCTSDAQCGSGRRCTSNGLCGLVGRPSCALDDECASGHCIGGICCNTDCAGPCRSCNLIGLEGTCSPLQAGASDPECPTCGLCDGLGGYVDAGADGPVE